MTQSTKRAFGIVLALLVIAVILAVVGFSQRSSVAKERDEAIAARDTLQEQAAQAETLTAEVTATSANLEVSKAEVEAAKAETESIKGSMETAMTDMQGQIDALIAERDGLQKEIEEGNTPEAHQKELDELNAQIKQRDEELEKFKAENKTALDEKNDLTAQVEDLNKQVQNLTNDLMAARNDVELARAEVPKDAQTRIDELMNKEQALQQERDEALAQAEEARAQVQENITQAQMDELNQQIATLAEERDNAVAGIAAAPENVQNQIDELNKTVETLTGERDKALEEARAAKEEIEKRATNEQMDELNAQIATLAAERDEALAQDSQRTDMQAQLDEANRQLEALAAERDTLQDNLKHAVSAEENKLQLTEKDADIARLNAELEAKTAIEPAAADAKIGLEEQIDALKAERDEAITQAQEARETADKNRYGIGAVTRVVEGTPTIVYKVTAGVVLDNENRIVSAVYDVLRADVSQAAQEPATSDETLRAFETFIAGKTADEVFDLETTPIEGQPDLPQWAGEEGGPAVLTAADFMQALRLAVESAK